MLLLNVRSAMNRRLCNTMIIKRLFDFLLAIFATIILLLPIGVVALFVRLTSHGPILYWSDRVGQHNKIFRMPKFRTMKADTPVVATHLLSDPQQFLTPIGSFLRRSSLDELPQLWSILKGNMSFVGPRPALFNQEDLVSLRAHYGVDKIKPGLTGWAQINGRDELPIPEKVQLDVQYMELQSFWFDLKIIFLTFQKVLKKDGITH